MQKPHEKVCAMECRRLLSTTALLVAVLCGGCISPARRLDVSAVEQIVVGQTTQADVERVFGPAHERITAAGDLMVARYFFDEIRKSADASWHVRHEHPGDILFRTLTVGYGANKIVARKLHDESLTPVYRTNAWYFVGPALEPESISFITRNVTVERDLVRRLGLPSGHTFDSHGQDVLFWFHGRGRENSFMSFELKKLIVTLGTNSIVRDYTLVEQPIPDADSPRTLH